MLHLKSNKDKGLAIFILVITVIFLIMAYLGTHGPVLTSNFACYKYLGCNIGFFGYDALQHFASGIMLTSVIIWIMRNFPSLSLFQNKFWKNFLILVALSALIAFIWEFGEFSFDQFRMKILHENLISENRLDQPTNNDTMGDMTFAVVATILTTIALKSFIEKNDEF